MSVLILDVDPELTTAMVERLSGEGDEVRVVTGFHGGYADSGYRILANHGPAAHQEVPHFHLHLFGGRDLGPMLRRER